MRLNTQQVSKLSGLPVPTIQRWVDDGLLVPAERGSDGRGNTHHFTVPQAVGLMVVGELRRHPRGCAPAYIRMVLGAFTNVDDAWLANELDAGRTHLAAVSGDGSEDYPYRPGLNPDKGYSWPDVEAAYATACAAATGRAARTAAAV